MSGRLRVTITSVVALLFAFERCAYNDVNVEFNCDNTTLAIELVSKTDVTTCRSIDGQIVVKATGGVEPYDFSINNSDYRTNSTFNDLGAGTYTVRVKDMNSCWKSIEVSVGAAGSSLNATVTTTADSQCSGDNGVATVNVTGGTGPYTYQLNSGGDGSSNVFTGLKEGQHVIIVKDAEACQRTIGIVIAHGNTGVSYGTQVKTIITNNCAKSGCHGAGAGARDWTNFDNLKANAANIRTRVQNRTMPPDATLSQANIDLISCWIEDGTPNN